MAKEIVWESLTPAEAETLTALVNSGKEAYAAPIEIERDREARKAQFRSLGITFAQCKTWYIGSERILVHLTPATKEVHDFMLSELRAKHRNAYRKRRCMVPGKLNGLIQCPECNKCSECPFPECRDRHEARELSWEGLIEKGYEGKPVEDTELRRVETQMELNAVCKIIDARNPLFTKAIVMKEYYGLSVAEIAEQLNTTVRNVYFFIGEAKKIGKQIKESDNA